MADTIEVTLNETSWTLVATGVAQGFITNEGNVKLKYRQAASLPAADSLIGHVLESGIGAFFSFSFKSGENLYMRSASKDSAVTITTES